MGDEPETPFDSVESAQEFVELLVEAIEEARREVEEAVTVPQPERRLQALQLVSFKLGKLAIHMETGRRLLNDLRTLRRLLLSERASEPEPPEDDQASPNLPSL
ncbi:MAG: hypothetical protein ABSH05_09810 [Bryobacteraceae bacterium]